MFGATPKRWVTPKHWLTLEEITIFTNQCLNLLLRKKKCLHVFSLSLAAFGCPPEFRSDARSRRRIFFMFDEYFYLLVVRKWQIWVKVEF